MHAWEQIQQSIDYIEDHLDGDISIEELSDKAALSPFYYQRLFSRLVKKPVAEYIKLRRMARATELLLESRKRILDIALSLGFSSHEHFTKTFKKTFGMTPVQYRAHPQALNRMTKPELLLNYVLIDEGVPLISEGIVLEVSRQTLVKPLHFIGLEQRMPVSFVQDLGIKSGIDPLDGLWKEFHRIKTTVLGLDDSAEEIGVSHQCEDPGFFTYFAGSRAESATVLDRCASWDLPAGEYAVCTFEAENFNALVMDALYKAEQYLYGIWLPRHKLASEPFCAERYHSHSSETTTMEVWVKLAQEK